MLEQSELKQVDNGQGYFVGEVAGNRGGFNYLKDGALVAYFDGIDTALDFVAAKMPNAKRGKSSSDVGRGWFNAFDTYEEALSTFRERPEEVVKYDPGELRIKDESESGVSVEYDVTGDFIDMGRYMEGIPEAVGTMRSGTARNRRVNIIIDLSYSAGTEFDTIVRRGERVLRLVDALESGGVRCNITVIESTECGHFEFVVKQHNEPLTISDLAVATHPEFLRRILFRIDEHSKTWEGGYGSSIAFSGALTPERLKSTSNDELNIFLGSNIYDAEGMFDKLERLLVWEMSKPVPEVDSIKVDRHGIFFNPNGYRSEADIRREGEEAIRGQS